MTGIYTTVCMCEVACHQGGMIGVAGMLRWYRALKGGTGCRAAQGDQMTGSAREAGYLSMDTECRAARGARHTYGGTQGGIGGDSRPGKAQGHKVSGVVER